MQCHQGRNLVATKVEATLYSTKQELCLAYFDVIRKEQAAEEL